MAVKVDVAHGDADWLHLLAAPSTVRGEAGEGVAPGIGHCSRVRTGTAAQGIVLLRVACRSAAKKLGKASLAFGEHGGTRTQCQVPLQWGVAILGHDWLEGSGAD